MTRTFLDAGVLIAAARGTGVIALHIAAAKCSGSEEFITTERPTPPLFRVPGIVIKTSTLP